MRVDGPSVIRRVVKAKQVWMTALTLELGHEDARRRSEVAMPTWTTVQDARRVASYIRDSVIIIGIAVKSMGIVHTQLIVVVLV